MRAAAIILAGLLLASCTHRGVATPTADPCVAFRPIYWGKADTRATLDQVDSHNRVWKQLCGTPKK